MVGFNANKTGLSPRSLPSDRSKAVPLLQFFSVCVINTNAFQLHITLRKHTYSNILKISPPKKTENFQIKDSDIFHISAQNIDCGYSLEPPRQGGSNESNLCF